MNNIENKELIALKGQVSKLEKRAGAVAINSPENYKEAIDLVTQLKDAGSRIKNKKESITKPLNEALRNTRELFKPIEEQFYNAEKTIKMKLLVYKTEINKKAEEKEAKIAERVDKGTLKLETAERKIEEVERVDQSTKGNFGDGIQIRKIKKVRIINEAVIPREYLIPDMVKIRRDALGGKTIEGIEIYEEESVAAGSL